LKGIPKLEDANEAGTKNSSGCTLILTEGDSAKTLAVAGLGVIGRDYYGVYPLKGKLLNVREASHKQILENKEINDLVKICGLQYKKKYESLDDLKSLRYGKVMIMTDQDQDGSHIKGLLINFIHYNWPTLMKLPFLEEFITPIVKASKKDDQHSFFSLPEFEEWKEATPNWHTYKIKYYKGLGTSTSQEAKVYFSDMARHRIKFRYNGNQDDHSIQLAFSKKEIEGRKEWLTQYMEEGKRRRELGLGEVYLYEKDTRAVNYSDFINKELVLFSNMDNERSIPSLVDGLKPGQRKVLFTCFKRNITNKEIKVAQLAGSVSEISAYHHGEASLMGTIINLAQNYIGSNNINLLQPIGQFGTRLSGGKDSASPRYIFTQLSPLARMIFHENDEPLLKNNYDDNLKIEPEWYIPIIPMVLVNGADGIGTGWMTKIPNFNPREIVANIRRLIRGEELKVMKPWFKGFKGTIEPLDDQRFVVNGEIATLSDTKLEITELPVRTWTSAYKEMLETMLQGNEKTPSLIQDYKDYNTDKTVKFIISMTADNLRKVEREKGLHTYFKLQTTISTTSMVLFDHNGCLRKFENVEEIVREFFDLRMEYYAKRKRFMEGLLGAEAAKLSNQAKFILEKCNNTLVIENKKKQAMIDELARRGYDSDPKKAWDKSVKEASGNDQEDESQDEDEESSDGGPDFDYLLGMKMWSLTLEKKNQLLESRDKKMQELKDLQATSKEQLYLKDLEVFEEKLTELEQKEIEDDAGDTKASKKKGGGPKKKGQTKAEIMPSPMGLRVVPRIADDLKVKAAKAVAAKNRKANKAETKVLKSVMDEKDEFDEMADDKNMNKSLSERLGLSGEKKSTAGSKKMKQTTLKFEKSSPKKKSGRNPWSDDDDDDDINDSDDSNLSAKIDSPVIPREKTTSRRAAAATKKYNLEDSEGESDSSDDMFDNEGVTEGKRQTAGKIEDSSDNDDFKPSPPAKTKSTTNGVNGHSKPAKKKKVEEDDDPFVVSDSDDESSLTAKLKKTSKPAASSGQQQRKLLSSDDLFDSMISNDDKVTAEKPATKKPTKRPIEDSDSDSDFGAKKKKPAPKPKAAPKPKKAPSAPKPKKKKLDSDSEDERPKTKAKGKSAKVMDSDASGSDMDFDASDIGPARDRPGRARKPVTYAADDASNSDDSDY